MGKTKKKKVHDPLETTMSLGDHLEELRARLILALLGLVIATVICLFFGRRIIDFIEKPYLNVYKLSSTDSQAEEKINNFVDEIFTGVRERLISDSNVPSISADVEEFIYKFSLETVKVLINDPNNTLLNPPTNKFSVAPRLQTLAPADGIISYIKIALMAGLILSSPWVFYQIWMFVAAGLYPHERKYVQTAVPFSAILFVTGALFFLLVVAPLTLKFLILFNQNILGATSNFTFADYISFITMLMLVFGVAFQTPIAIFILTRTGLVTIQSLRKSRKFVILLIFILAAMATPPDVISQVTLAIPLYALFELGILLSWLAERRNKFKNAID